MALVSSKTKENCLCDSPALHLYEPFQKYEYQIESMSVDVPWGNVCAYTKNSDWREYWPILAEYGKECNVVAVAADFYLLEYIVYASGVSRVSEDDEIVQQFLEAGFTFNSTIQIGLAARQQQAWVEEVWGAVLVDYLHWACVAEMTHSYAVCETMNWTTWATAFRGWGKIVNRFGRVQAAEWAVEVFNQPWKNNAFGGWRWRAIAELLLAVEKGDMLGQKFDYHLFMDRVFSLQHNTGGVFSKWNWNETEMDSGHSVYWYPGIHNVGNIYTILDAHHEGRIATLANHAHHQSAMLYYQLLGEHRP